MLNFQERCHFQEELEKTEECIKCSVHIRDIALEKFQKHIFLRFVFMVWDDEQTIIIIIEDMIDCGCFWMIWN